MKILSVKQYSKVIFITELVEGNRSVVCYSFIYWTPPLYEYLLGIKRSCNQQIRMKKSPLSM